MQTTSIPVGGRYEPESMWCSGDEALAIEVHEWFKRLVDQQHERQNDGQHESN